MNHGVARVRMFAGPNGSGKTTVKSALKKPKSWFGIYINPDELESEIASSGMIDLSQFGLTISLEELRRHFLAAPLLRRNSLRVAANEIRFANGMIGFESVTFTSYHASVLCDFLRRQALAQSRPFSFETVMSSDDKVTLFRDAQSLGFRTYLYYVATEHPAINLQRVRKRVSEGGHDVPADKVVMCYYRSLALLPQAIRNSNRAYLFDASRDESWYFAEVTGGRRIRYTSDNIPNWFAPHANQFSNER
jgi:predicted ABC-type ATPase